MFSWTFSSASRRIFVAATLGKQRLLGLNAAPLLKNTSTTAAAAAAAGATAKLHAARSLLDQWLRRKHNRSRSKCANYLQTTRCRVSTERRVRVSES